MSLRFFNQLGASLLDRTICATAGATGYQYTIGASIGTDLEQFQDAKLILIWGGNPIASNLHFWMRAQEAKRQWRHLDCHRSVSLADRRKMPSAHCAAARHRCRAGAGHDARADPGRPARPRLHRHSTRSVSTQLKARALEWTPERTAEICGITVDEVVESGAPVRPDREERRGRSRSASTTACSACAAAAWPCAISPACRPWWAPGAMPAGGIQLSTLGARSRPTARRCSARICWPAARRARST